MGPNDWNVFLMFRHVTYLSKALQIIASCYLFKVGLGIIDYTVSTINYWRISVKWYSKKWNHLSDRTTLHNVNMIIWKIRTEQKDLNIFTLRFPCCNFFTCDF